MQVIQGKPISPGYAQGRAVLFGVDDLSAPRRIVAADGIEGEIERFHAALENSQQDLLHLQERVQSELGSSEAEIFTAHLLFLKDRQLIDRVERAIRENRLGVEAAIEHAVTELVDILNQSDNAYLRERPANTQDSATKKANRERLAFRDWWRRAESNRRPRALSHWHYMLSPVFDLTDCYPTGREDKRRSR